MVIRRIFRKIKLGKFIRLLVLSILLTLIYYKYSLKNDYNNHVKINTIKGKQYLVFTCNVIGLCGGVADRLKGIMSVYALSLLTDRQLIINMTYPCTLENYLIPNEVEWTQHVPNGLKMIEWNILDSNFGQVSKIKEAVDLNELWMNSDVVTMKINLHILKTLSKNVNYHKKIRELGYVVI